MKNLPPGSFSVGAPSRKASVPSASGPSPWMKASETMPEVPSNTALMPSLSICERMRTPIGREPAEIDHLRIERLDLREFGGEVLLVGGDAEGADDLRLPRLARASLKYWLWPLP